MPNPPRRSQIQIGSLVDIVEKHNQSTGTLTRGVVIHILTSSPAHPHGIKVKLVTGQVGRVQSLVVAEPRQPSLG